MSRRCELQKQYYKEFGSYKGDGKYSDHYVKWLENEVLALRLCTFVGQSEQLKAYNEYLQARICNADEFNFPELLKDFESL